MTKVLQCSDGGLICGKSVEGETEEEVLEKAVAHVQKDHGVDLTQAQTLVRYAQTLIHDKETR